MKLNFIQNKEWGVMLLSFLLLSLALSTGSIWTDEARTWLFVNTPFGDMVQQITKTSGSEAQMPLYLILHWCFAQVFGVSELALRLPNLIWSFIALWSMMAVSRIVKLPWLPLLLAVSPFAWFYMDEARPYMMQVAGASLMLFALLKLYSKGEGGAKEPLLFVIGAWITCGASMLGAVPCGASAIVFAWWVLKGKVRLQRDGWIVLFFGCFTLLLLGGYYALTLSRGAAGARQWDAGIGSILFAFYELLGFLGLGPGRLEIRNLAKAGTSSLVAAMWLWLPLIGILVFAYGVLLVKAIAKWRNWGSGWLPAMAFVVVATSGGLLTLSLMVNWPFWGRHLAPLLPFLVLIIGFVAGLPGFWNSQRWLPLLIGCVWLFSAIGIRWFPHQAEDDYRRAALVAEENLKDGKLVWWAADEPSLWYYGVPISGGSYYKMPNGVKALYAPEPSDLSGPNPKLVILSRPDQFDVHGNIQSYMKENHFQCVDEFPGFTIWKPLWE